MIGLVTSVVAAYYYLRIVKIMYFDEPAAAFDKAPTVLRVVLAVRGDFCRAYVRLSGALLCGDGRRRQDIVLNFAAGAL